MVHAELAPIAYGTPLLSTLVLLASGERLETLGLIGCGLIVLCSAGVVIVAQRPRLKTASTAGRPHGTGVARR